MIEREPQLVINDIVGSGDIATVLKELEPTGKLYFASGVSNSQETRESEYEREKTLLLEQDKTKQLVYFGSLSVFYSNNRYSEHKKEMESLVKENFEKNAIVRIGNIDWGTNPHTVINYLRNRYENGEEMTIQDTYRYVVSKDEFLYWVSMIPNWSCEMNIPGERLHMSQIVDKYVIHRK